MGMFQLRALVLGAVQGLSEFLPVSSSAHLVLVPWLYNELYGNQARKNWQDPGLPFDVALHLGTLLALVMYYWRDWLAMGASIFNSDRHRRRLLGLLIVASVPGATVGLGFEKQAETVFRSPLLIATALAVLGLALWVCDRFEPQRRTMAQITFRDAFLIGLSQAFAIVPGVSRSGATITMARIVRVKREDAAHFSFLMATPIIAGAGLVEGGHLLVTGILPTVWIGFATAAIFGLISIAVLIRFVRTRTYQPFAWYRIAFAAFVIVVFLRH